MRAGLLRQRITIQTPTATLDAAGQPIRTWATFGTANLPAKAEPVSGGEVIRGRQVSAETQWMFTVRYLAGVTAQMRVIWGSRTLGIVKAEDPYGEQHELRIECREAV